jgi:hypothetical protein
MDVAIEAIVKSDKLMEAEDDEKGSNSDENMDLAAAAVSAEYVNVLPDSFRNSSMRKTFKITCGTLPLQLQPTEPFPRIKYKESSR